MTSEFDFDIDVVRRAVDAIKTEEIRETASFLRSNFVMIESLCGLPDSIATYASLVAVANERIAAVEERYKAPIRDAKEGEAMQIIDNVNAYVEKFKGEASAAHASFHASVRAREIVERATNDLRSTALDDWPERQSAFHALFGAAVILAWTAFECLAADLWVRALNLCPETLGSKTAKTIETTGAPRDSGSLGGKWVEVDVLRRYGFDVRLHLGSILKDKFTFSDVKDLHSAYRASFGKSPELDGIFENKELRLLAAVRNLLVHRAGIIDSRFRKRVSPHDAELAALKDGELFTMMGPWPTRLVRAAIAASSSLLSYVDDSIISARNRAGNEA